jgi:hypothetical protein
LEDDARKGEDGDCGLEVDCGMSHGDGDSVQLSMILLLIQKSGQVMLGSEESMARPLEANNAEL